MKMNVKFTENDADFAVKFSESDTDLTVKFDESNTEVPLSFGEVYMIGGISVSEVERIIAAYMEEHNITSGKDGVSPTITVKETEVGCLITITDSSGIKTIALRNGVDGRDGKDGLNGADGVDGKDGRDGIAGVDGKDGKDGVDGYTPRKGIDYFTPEDISQIASEASKFVTIDKVDPSQVIFPDGASTTYEIGKVKLENGRGTLVEPGGSLADFFDVFINEKNPEIVQPSISIEFEQAGSYEAGTKITPVYRVNLDPGSYAYGPDTGVVATSWRVTDTDNHRSIEDSGEFEEFQVSDGISYEITARVTYDAGTIPVTNMGNPFPNGQIEAGTKYATSEPVVGYRNTFYGTYNVKRDITSNMIRGLTGKSGRDVFNGYCFTITAPVGALRVMFAYPEDLRDVTSVKDVNGMGSEIASSFVKHVVNVNGANDYKAIRYKVYILDFANPNDKENNYIVQI